MAGLVCMLPNMEGREPNPINFTEGNKGMLRPLPHKGGDGHGNCRRVRQRNQHVRRSDLREERPAFFVEAHKRFVSHTVVNGD
jgi:hypothetical protein